jgi:hypothetical protein
MRVQMLNCKTCEPGIILPQITFKNLDNIFYKNKMKLFLLLDFEGDLTEL